MTLHQAMRRLEIGLYSVCSQCRRNVGTSSRPRQQRQSETSLLTESLQARSREFDQPLKTAAPPTSSAAAVNRSSASQAIRTAQANLLESAGARRAMERDQIQEAQRRLDSEEYERQLTRRWRRGDIYSPHDLSGVEMSKWDSIRRAPIPKKVRGGGDVLDRLGINPMHHYKNFSIMSEYMTETGRIRRRAETGLRLVNQRRMAKAVRRAVGIGLLPAVHRHPELILLTEKESQNRRR